MIQDRVSANIVRCQDEKGRSARATDVCAKLQVCVALTRPTMALQFWS